MSDLYSLLPTPIHTLLSHLSSQRRWIIATLAGFYIIRVYQRLRERKTIGMCDSRGKLYPLEKHIFPNHIVNRQGLWLYTRAWTIPTPRGIIFLCHGLGEHIQRYEHVAQTLNAAGYSVYGMDHQGHGQSQGTRCYVEDFNDFTIDYVQFVKHVQSKLGKPISCFLYGHSMGGAIAINIMRATYTSTSSTATSTSTSASREIWPWTGCILSAPALVPDPAAAKPHMIKLARILAKYVPKLGLDKLDSTAVSRIPSVVANYQNDPLVYHEGLMVNFANQFLLTFDSIRDYIPEIEWPFLLVHGDQDRLVNISGSRHLIEHAATEDKTIKIYQAGYHELHNDLASQQVMEDIIMWLKARTV